MHGREVARKNFTYKLQKDAVIQDVVLDVVTVVESSHLEPMGSKRLAPISTARKDLQSTLDSLQVWFVLPTLPCRPEAPFDPAQNISRRNA